MFENSFWDFSDYDVAEFIFQTIKSSEIQTLIWCCLWTDKYINSKMDSSNMQLIYKWNMVGMMSFAVFFKFFSSLETVKIEKKSIESETISCG